MVEGQSLAVIGRITEVRLPDRDRLTVEPERSEGQAEANPIGVIRLLGSISLASGRSSRGIAEAPRIGDYVYLAHPDLIRHAIDSTGAPDAKRVEIGSLAGSSDTMISMSPHALFGRHCAVLGSTGGGKSWTMSKLIEEVSRLNGKVLLIDPTGEYHSLTGAVVHVHLGGSSTGPLDDRQFVSFPHEHLSEQDLFALFQPSAGVQAPKLRDALASLKLLQLEPSLGTNGILVKANTQKKPINAAIIAHDAEISAPSAPYDITKLAHQIMHECVFPNPATGGSGSWGGTHDASLSNCVTLGMRVENAVKSAPLASIFAPHPSMVDLTKVIDTFLSGSDSVLRISVQYLPFEHYARELVVNALGRHLLGRARRGDFHQVPMVAALDEAHQFLNKSVGDEINKVNLDAFGLIAKEGRKYGLTCLLATQRPRDIPEDVLSQVGMFFVHRLINERDQQVVVNASGAIDASVAAFLPNLREGEALIVGSHVIMPLPVQVAVPFAKPSIPIAGGATWISD